MTRKVARPVWAGLASLVVLFVVSLTPVPHAASGPGIPQAVADRIPDTVRERVARSGRVRVIVELNPRTGAHVAEGQLSGPAAAAQRRDIGVAASRVISSLRFGARDVVRRFDAVPYVALDLDAEGLTAIERSPDVVQVMDDAIVRPALAQSVPL